MISDFPSTIYANFYSTKRKSVKNASDSSLKFISYSSIFATNDPASQASLIGQSPVSEVQEAPADGGCALFYSALVSDGHLVSHRGVMAVSLPVVRRLDCPACGNLCGWPAAWPARGVCVACARECGKRCSG